MTRRSRDAPCDPFGGTAVNGVKKFRGPAYTTFNEKQLP